MKTPLKILTPTISTLGIATISIASCGTPTTDGLIAIPTQYLNIDGTTLNGIKSEYEYTDLKAKGYSKLTVPKAIENVTVNGNGTKAYNAITKIDFEADSKCESLKSGAISAATELTTIVLPSNLNTIGVRAIVSCEKLNTIDISNVSDISVLNTGTVWAYTIADNGKLIVASDKETIGNQILDKLSLNNWTIEVVSKTN